jgi:hypothetical protein
VQITCDGVRSTYTPDSRVVLDVTRGQMFQLNPVGSRILQLLKGGSCRSEIGDIVSNQFEISRSITEADVLEFLKALKSRGLIEERESNGKI